MKKTTILATFLILIVAASSCSTGSMFHRARPNFEPIPPPVQTASTPKYEGSLWEEQGTQSRLFTDPRARQVNDVITVLVVENVRAKGTTTTNSNKDSSYDAEITKLFGLPSSLGMSNFLGSGEPFQPKVSATTKNDFKGSGDTARTGLLTATITARVIEVYPNGTMKIGGVRQVTINKETQYLVLTGIVRPEDISVGNVVSSDRIAEARIEYYGEGVLADKDRPGWLARALDWISPF
jgi:flagellar L-ring protein precursor FlgH